MVSNAKTLAEELSSLGYKVVTGGTDNHIVLVDLSTVKLSGAKAERILELVDISVNKNTGKNIGDRYFVLLTCLGILAYLIYVTTVCELVSG